MSISKAVPEEQLVEMAPAQDQEFMEEVRVQEQVMEEMEEIISVDMPEVLAMAL